MRRSGGLPLKIAMVGDVMLGRLVNEALVERSPEYPWGDTLQVLRQADVRACNLECAIADDGEPWSATPKEFHFRSDRKNVSSLLAAGVDVVSLANNHSLDFGYDGLTDTVEALERARIKHAGAGRSLSEAERAAMLEIRGTRIGMIAFTDNEPGWEASSDGPGTFYVPVELKDERAKRLLELTARTKRSVDVMIVSAHWGPNWGYAPPKDHQSFAHALVEAGADVVFGHSAHVFRGVEVYKNRPILYCAGDFVDDYAVDRVERNDESFIFMLETTRGSVSRVMLYPTKIEMCQARLARGPEARAIPQRMRRLCARFNTASKWEEAGGYLEIDIAQGR